MKKEDLIQLIDTMEDGVEYMLGDSKHIYELKTTAVCGGTQAAMPYFCVLPPNHEGDCYCSCKDVNFISETPEEIKEFYDSINK